ncbi:MAG TPA: hypothetical protein VD788_13625, partial [Candidatus Polarisedimenticolaceae bacterium]|nr:hypothetical protein [Candidatus Polarisedimenticolaceae bacterium]
MYTRLVRPRRLGGVSIALLTLVAASPHAAATDPPDAAAGEVIEMTALSWDFLEDLTVPLDKWRKGVEAEKNDDGVSFKSAGYSRTPRKVDDGTYVFSAHVNTANRNHQLTERMELTVKHAGGDRWELADQQVVDSHVGLYRATGMACAPFASFSFEREGIELTASNGSVCEAYFEGRVSSFVLRADDLAYDYAPPEHAALAPTGKDFYALHELARRTHQSQLGIRPAAAFVRCDVTTCEELLEQRFTGLERKPADERASVGYDRTVADWIRPVVDDVLKARKEDAFSGFRVLDEPGNRWFNLFLPTDINARDEGVQLAYDNWGVDDSGWEVKFYVWPKRWDVPNQLGGAIYGYFSEETIRTTDPYELERRQGGLARWFEVESLRGTVDLATLDVEQLQGDVEFGLRLAQETDTLPFGIISFDIGSGGEPKPITVNSIRVDGRELTWVKTGPLTGIAILPEKMPAGSRVDVRMHWESQAILKFTSSYSYLPRQGWVPFVRFGDLIDEFELTIRSPVKYDVLGAGRRVEERVEGDVRVSTWRAAMPVNFPTVIFGRYRSDTPGKGVTAKKLDGTEIPIEIHVDADSFAQEGIAPGALRPLAAQAANSINLYAAMTGVDYPFGGLNLVNDPSGLYLYGQAPSSIL